MPRESDGLVKIRHKTNAKNSNVPATVNALLAKIGNGIADPISVKPMFSLLSPVI